MNKRIADLENHGVGQLNRSGVTYGDYAPAEV
jgi:hypothetical protein